jgi:hypothetical protein
MARCRQCGERLTAQLSIDLGIGPICAARLGLTAADLLPDRPGAPRYSQSVLQLLLGVGQVHGITRHDGSRGWVDIATGQLVTETEAAGATAPVAQQGAALGSLTSPLVLAPAS